MAIISGIFRFFGRGKTAIPPLKSTLPEEFDPKEWLERNPEFAQKIKEWVASQAIIESSAGREPEYFEKLHKIIFSRAFFAMCLHREDTTACYSEGILKGADLLTTNKEEEAIPSLSRGITDIVKLLSAVAGRQFPPLSVAEDVKFLCERLREVNRSAGSSYLILNRRPTDSDAIECDLICEADKCDSIDTAVLSKEIVYALDRHKLVWRCPNHRGVDSPASLPKVPDPKVLELLERASKLRAKATAKVREIQELRRDISNAQRELSLSVSDELTLWRLHDSIIDILDNAMDQIPSLRDSPETQDLRSLRAGYKKTFSREYMMAMERFLEKGSNEDYVAFCDLLFPKAHSSRLATILDYSTDSQRATCSQMFRDWIRLKGYSPSEVDEHVDVEVIKRLTSNQPS